MNTTSDRISRKLQYLLKNDSPVLLCIGSDRITGDCLGPMVGQMLVSQFSVPAYVYGTLENPVTALNLESVIAFIRSKHPFSKILAIDSCIGSAAGIGDIRVFRGGLLPGSADGKNLPKVGDVSITATVCDQAPASTSFASVRLGFVYSLARSISEGIMDCLLSFSRSLGHGSQTELVV